jgi:hypothetical protein
MVAKSKFYSVSQRAAANFWLLCGDSSRCLLEGKLNCSRRYRQIPRAHPTHRTCWQRNHSIFFASYLVLTSPVARESLESILRWSYLIMSSNGHQLCKCKRTKNHSSLSLSHSNIAVCPLSQSLCVVVGCSANMAPVFRAHTPFLSLLSSLLDPAVFVE